MLLTSRANDLKAFSLTMKPAVMKPSRYCNDDARELIKNLPEVKGGSFKALSERLRDFYGLSDRRQKYTRERLAKFCYHSRSIKSEADLDEYYREFVTQVQHLAKKGTIADRDRDDLFWQGIPRRLQKVAYPNLRETKGFDPTKPLEYSAAYKCIKLCVTEDLYYNTGHLPKSSSKLLVAHKKSKAKKSYYKHKSDSDSSSSSSSDSSDDESPAKEPESDSDSEVPVRATTSPKKAVVHHKAPVIPTIRNVADQVGELARSFDEMKIHFARSLPNDNPRPNSNQIHPQTSSPATYPNNYPLGMPQNQYMQ
ncbi:hypothetical protein BS47DRAFT_1358833 [Hydnum rufescens UP504]|uniref:Uncharacterized protein n=1 Tax=Hydnum rufescens UP504 TaxID=1448309 RepID=A0A9P6E128_9AGAM|nr:hypothetical protein BS47DRAFT_1358833 [Hydnum rufescens UP504]